MINHPALSKINWTQVVAVIAMLTSVFGFDFPPETQVNIGMAITGIQSAVTIIFRTWMTEKV